ncbi:MAG: SUMF1/EgtB/PvdO family nonheme iron enzyme [Sorangiineae bacterium]|nr:SUMF1/EgtB/PvdO family nonheme iron enzyme [Polyangiaceae bacterium]MEB2323260.1 SUMF1/EgtB/PvdO family nonheme iron enzyme [Sorangiineae bacterium]
MRRLAALVLLGTLLGCSRTEPRADADASAPRVGASVSAVAVEPAGPPRLLYLPDGGDVAPPRASGQELLPGPWGLRGPSRCPPEMVDVRGRFCIDRYEASLVDARSGRELSPYYHPTRRATAELYGLWQKRRGDEPTEAGRSMTVPAPPAWQLSSDPEPKATSRAGVTPNGYLDAMTAARACGAAGKRLCAPDEWMMACRGEQGRKFPYGATYQQGKCNVFREAHPAAVLHGNASTGHLDPRLNLVAVGGRRLLRATGATPDCRSQWGEDAIYDMVGNLDEWVDSERGLFLGGFYSRSTREGCDSSVSAHPRQYFDYSLGVRCCK